ncbi:hypothetical protein PIB30_100425 [Stylosanthes scabra]|uniref:Uncharacterized protein n=1 Tax=Stylosanthes scabra TaxID=79078 RepID=A0ABU6RY17_9FABA|nr:hypothetical protein [Stylosanthes scabra]
MEVAKKGTRNEKIMKKSLEASFSPCAYAPTPWCMHTHQIRCIRTHTLVRTHPPNLASKFTKQLRRHTHFGAPRFLEIEKYMGKAKKGIGSKRFMKRSQKTEEVASEVASEAAHATLE